MTFGQFWSVMRARRWAALAVFLLVVLTTLVVSLLLPKQYKAEASVVIDVKPDPVAAMMNPSMAMPSFMATQVDILGSERVVLRVIRDLKLLENPQLREQWQTDGEGKGTIEQWLVTLLQKQLDVKPSRESNVISITYKAPNPRFAAGMANAFAQAYIATTLELRVDPAKQFSSFFVQQSKDAREAQIQAVASESGSRQQQAQGGQGDRIQDVLTNPLISGLKSDLSRGEARLQELNSKYGDNHPQVVEAKANINELRSRLETETRRITGGVTVSNNINKQRESQVRRELESQRARVAQMKVARDQGQVLIREVENAQRTFDGLMSRMNQSALESQTTQSYANVLSSALPPVEHSTPRLFLNIPLSVLLGALLAVGVAMLLEMTDRRVRASEDVVAALGLPILGVLPKPNAKRLALGKRPALEAPRVIGLPMADKHKGE